MSRKNIVLDEWQRELLAHDGNLLLCTGRQVGKTTIFSIKAAEYLVRHPNSRIIIVSLTEDQAKLIIVMILDYLEKHYKTEIGKGKDKPTQNKVTLKNKAVALARPVGNTGDAVRGFTGDILIIDEASRMPELVWTAGKPTLLTTAGQIWICSTPAGKKGYFWEAFQNKNDKFKVFRISSEEVIRNRPISESWTERQRDEAIKFLEQERKDMTELQYGQEYLGLFLDDLMRFFDDKLINEVCTIKREEIGRQTRRFYLGVDIARMGRDETALQILEKINNDMLYHRENITYTKKLTTETERRIIELSESWNVRRIGIDAGAGSLGVGILDHLLEQSETKRKVVAINNRMRELDRDGKRKQRLLKEDLYDNLRSLMEKNKIRLLNDENVILSLRSIQYEIDEQGRVRIFGNYSHIVEGLIRAAWVAKEDKTFNKIWSFKI